MRGSFSLGKKAKKRDVGVAGRARAGHARWYADPCGFPQVGMQCTVSLRTDADR